MSHPFPHTSAQVLSQELHIPALPGSVSLGRCCLLLSLTLWAGYRLLLLSVPLPKHVEGYGGVDLAG